jgi:hypothetical protein
MKTRKSLIIVLLFLTTTFSQQIGNYIPFCGWGTNNITGDEFIVLRRFEVDSHICYFTLSPQTLKTTFYLSDSLTINPMLWEAVRARYESTPYIRAISKAEMDADTIQDAGLRSFLPTQKGINLTIDLCPSYRPLDRKLFTSLITEVGNVETPVPVSISITGRWMAKHSGDLNWLDSLVTANKLSITWIDHTYNHYTKKDVPLKTNFMLAPGVDIYAEILKTEVALLQKNHIPSIFFRFPGLVSDCKAFDEVISLGLIPVGCDAWLAKGQSPKNGSIVLIHANGNEPLGVQEFIALLKKKHSEVLSKDWELLDLRESLIEDESK